MYVMKHTFNNGVDTTMSKEEHYKRLGPSLRALLEDEHDPVANMANFSAFIFYNVPDLNWVGFYLNKSGELLLGPFQGKPACIRIPFGSGVCGTAASTGQPQVVPDVHAFPGHIACDAASQSEIVLPVFSGRELFGVLDIDSPLRGRFTDSDRQGLQKLLDIFVEQTTFM